MTEDMSGVHCPEYGVVLPEEIAGLIERLEKRVNSLVHNSGGIYKHEDYAEWQAAAHLRALAQENEQKTKLLAYATDTDAYRTLRKRNEELAQENERLKAQVPQELLDAITLQQSYSDRIRELEAENDTLRNSINPVRPAPLSS